MSIYLSAEWKSEDTSDSIEQSQRTSLASSKRKSRGYRTHTIVRRLASHATSPLANEDAYGRRVSLYPYICQYLSCGHCRVIYGLSDNKLRPVVATCALICHSVVQFCFSRVRTTAKDWISEQVPLQDYQMQLAVQFSFIWWLTSEITPQPHCIFVWKVIIVSRALINYL
jgi:hypothetical protein